MGIHRAREVGLSSTTDINALLYDGDTPPNTCSIHVGQLTEIPSLPRAACLS